MEQTIKLAVDGMHCDGCVRRLTAALAAIDGARVDSVKVGSAVVTYDPARTSPGQIATGADRIGFTARVEP